MKYEYKKKKYFGLEFFYKKSIKFIKKKLKRTN